MTKIILQKDSMFGFRSIITDGHSGYSDAGSDIVCAYISSSVELVMNILIDALGTDTETHIDPEKAFVYIKVLPTAKNAELSESICAVMNGFEIQMKDFSKQFPKFVSITYAKE